MSALVNGCKVNQISVNDRGLMYGQCVFETIAVQNAKPCLLDLHIASLLKGANVLGIPADADTIVDEVMQLSSSVELGIVRINLTG